MIITNLQNSLFHKDFFVFAACDSVYFDEFGKSLINSLLKNTKHNIHLHIFNPKDDQLNFCSKNNRIYVSYEFIKLEDLSNATNKWHSDDVKELHNYKRIITAMKKSNDSSIGERILKTYYACARFIRLKEMSEHTESFFAIDIDAIVRKEIPELPNDHDIYIHQVVDKNPRWLAGGIYINTALGKEFLKEYASVLEENIKLDNLYWGLDQDVLKDIVPKYNWGILPTTLIDWHMTDDSVIWTAKGTRKNVKKFILEQASYAF